MAGGQERLLRRRIKSIQSTQKITRAQELIAASRIARAQATVAAAQPYSESISQVVSDLARGAGGASPMLVPRAEIRRVAYIVVAGDRGLCGAYNTSVIRAAERSVAEHQRAGRDYALFLVGRKAEGYFRHREYRVDGAYTGFSDRPTYDDARTIGEAVTAAFVAEEADLVEIVYTKFVTVGTQVVVQETLVPLSREGVVDDASGELRAAYEFEPSAEGILDLLLPRYVDSRIYAALLNGAASEHAARQRAMKSATDNAEDLITTLSRSMNRARQDAITTEIMEIVGGAEALRKPTGPRGDDLLPDSVEARDADLFRDRSSDN
ncbi:MAG: F0F1 ATP synthase subunit gamma [Acidimicrobiia bacterium]